MRIFLPKRLLLLLPGIAALLVTRYAQYNPDWAEAYSQSIYPALSSIVGFVPTFLPFSVGEWVAALFLLFCLGYVGYYIRAIIVGKRSAADQTSVLEPSDCRSKKPKSHSRWAILYRGVVGAFAIVSVAYCAFTMLCGINYYRYTFSSHLGYEIQQSSTAELEQLCVSLAGRLGEARETLGNDVSLIQSDADTFNSCAQISVEAMQKLSKQYPALNRPFYSEPKPVVVSELMSDAGIAGMFFPFTVESNVNDDIPLFTIPSTMTHELAHQCGFMREDEANFIAYLACMQIDDPLAHYSGLYLAYVNASNALMRVDSQAAYDIRSGLPEAVRQDMQQNSLFWAAHEGIVADVSESTNDAYLKANNQSDGVSSYGRMVDLLLAEQRSSAATR